MNHKNQVMKKILLPILAMTILISCEKSEKQVEKIEFIQSIQGGCEDHDSTFLKDQNWEPDTSYFTLENGNLDIFVGFTANCVRKFTTDQYIRNDTIFIEINRIPGPLAGCQCYFTFNFLFEGIIYNHHYYVNVDDYLHFYGFIEP